MKMNKNSIIVSSLLSLIIIILYFINSTYTSTYTEANDAYKVYLDGQEIGLIKDKDELYALINNEQQTIKDTYDVRYVYPPSGLDIVHVKTFADNYNNVENIYQNIEKLDDFTVKGYIITIKKTDKENITINVLNKDIFAEALRNFVLSFITEDELNKYNNGNRSITEIGSVIRDMGFAESITIKEGYISVSDKIYTSTDDLSQYLLFGPNVQKDTYTVKEGDSIASISEDNQISTQEFLIANPKYSNDTALLSVGSTVNVTLINPIITLTYNLYEISENETPYSTETVVDNTKPSDYQEITKSGVNGLTLIHASYDVVNGTQSNEANIESREVIREMVKEEVTVGKKKTTPIYRPSGNYVYTSGWGYPTNYPFMVTSPFGWRSYKMHLGVDISGTGFRSPIYAVADGTVTEATYRSTDGNYVIIEHENNIYTQYAHMYKYFVKTGDYVTKGQQIGEMGESGLAYGVHLHFGVSIGNPFHGSYSFQNPLNYIKLQ